jgi:hypothetical protein
VNWVRLLGLVRILGCSSGGDVCDSCTSDDDCDPDRILFCGTFGEEQRCANERRETECCNELSGGSSACSIIYGRPRPPPEPGWRCSEVAPSSDVFQCNCRFSDEGAGSVCSREYPCCYSLVEDGTRECICFNATEVTCGDRVNERGAMREARCPAP